MRTLAFLFSFLSAATQLRAGLSTDQPATGDADRKGRAEIVLPKATAYVGEPITVDFRLSIDERVRYHIDNLPTFKAEAFTKTKLFATRSNTVVRNGHTYEITVSQATLAPIKAGKLSVGPVTFQYIAQLPRAEPPTPRRSRNFFDQFFNQPSGNFGQPQRVTAISETAELEVKPFPVAGRPANFSGAVGQFELSAQGAPERVKTGDPIMMKITVTGTGNFERVTAPVLSDATGWHAYQPTATYKAADESGVKGTKNFEIAIIPLARQEELPVYEFSYFDPVAEKYVTLKTGRPPLPNDGRATGLKIEKKLPSPPLARQTKEQEAEERAAAEAGRMTEAQARSLLESLRSEDIQVCLLNPKSRAPRNATIRDW